MTLKITPPASIYITALPPHASPVDFHIYQACQFATRWADLMEDQVATGRSVESCANETSLLADSDVITALQFQHAANLLHTYWIHGEQLAFLFCSREKASTTLENAPQNIATAGQPQQAGAPAH